MIPIPVASTATTTKVGTSVSALWPAIVSAACAGEPGPIAPVLVRFCVITAVTPRYIVAN
jgi:hypothetical protein